MSTTPGFEKALRDLAVGRNRIAIVYDEAKGWCVTDTVDRGGAFLILSHTFRKTPGEAVAAFHSLCLQKANIDAEMCRTRKYWQGGQL